MVESFDGDWDKTDVSEYAAWMFSAFAFGEFFSGMLWGKVSDCVGRKPVLLMGLFGTAVSMIWFGFARSFWVACAARAVGGILNGNMGVLNTTVAELVPRKDHQSWVFSMIPFVWSVGTIIGSALGGSLAMPCDSHPSWFSRGSLWETYPFLLPNLVCVFIILIGIVFGFLYLEETHTARKAARNRRATIDHGPGSDKASLFPAGETQSLLGGDPPPGYSSVESSPLLRSTPAAAFECDSEILAEKAAPEPKRTINKQIILIIAANATLA
jgi:MFS family permease